MRILAGDIGGTNTRLALVEVAGNVARIVEERKFPSRNYSGLSEVIREFTATVPCSVERASFGIAGPVKRRKVHTPNLPWIVSAEQIECDFKLRHVALLNDVEANAYGIAVLAPTDLKLVKPGSGIAGGNIAILSPGTGLGQAGMIWDGAVYRPFGTEGGHADFAPQDDLEIDFLRFLKTQFGHVSYERALSGPGLVNAYRFLLQRRGAEQSQAMTTALASGDMAGAIASAALAKSDTTCEEALTLFVRILGAQAGNLALSLMATGGVFLGGGIPPKIVARVESQDFMESFCNKGRLKHLLEEVPVSIILNDKTALLGAAYAGSVLMDSYGR